MSEPSRIKDSVKQAYSSLAEERTTTLDQDCCGTAPNRGKLIRYGYSEEELALLPESVIVMADGCGNPTGLGMIREGETVLDLGSGGGIDVFLASRKVGPGGKVIGLDMTPAMISRAEENARRMKLSNVEFKMGEIENMPLPDNSTDVIMSNCVICLSPDKEKVFREMYRVLKHNGRLAIADEIAAKPFTKEEKADDGKWCSCVTGAITENEYARMLQVAGFEDVYVKQLRPTGDSLVGVFSAFISSRKP